MLFNLNLDIAGRPAPVLVSPFRVLADSNEEEGDESGDNNAATAVLDECRGGSKDGGANDDNGDDVPAAKASDKTDFSF